MAAHETPPGNRQPGRRRWGRRLAGTSAVLLLLGLLAFHFRDAWLGPLAVRFLERLARERLGAELTIERATGSWLEGLTLEGVRWRASEPPLRAVEEARVELGWSLRGALRGEPRVRVRLEARGLELEIPEAQGEPRDAAEGPLEGELEALELELTDVLLRLPGAEPFELARVAVRGGLAGSRARVESLELVAGPNRLTLSQAALDLAAGDGLAIARSLHGELALLVPDVSLLEPLAGRPLPVRAAELSLSVAGERARLAGRAELERGWLVVESGEVVWPAGASLAELELALRLQGELEDLGVLAPLVGQPLAGRWRGSIDLAGPLRHPSGRFDGHGEGLEIAGIALGAVEIDVQTDGESARLERCEVRGRALEAVLRGELGLQPLELRGLSLSVSAGAEALAPFLPFPCERVSVHARLDGPPRAPRGEFELSLSGAQFAGLPVDDAEARGRVEGNRLELAELHITSGESRLEAAGTIERQGESWSAELERLALIWHEARAEIEAGARIALGPGRFAAEGLVLTSSGAAGTGHARASVLHEEGRTRAALSFEDYDAGPLLAPFLPREVRAGRLRGKLEGTLGTAADAVQPALELDLALLGWQVGAWPGLQAVLRGSYDGEELVLERLELDFPVEERVQLAGTLRVPLAMGAALPFAPGNVSMQLEGRSGDLARSLRRAGVEPGLERTGPCGFGLDLAGEWRALAGRVTLAAREVTLGSGANARACDVEVALALGPSIEIERGVLSAPSGSIVLSGSIDTPLDPGRWRTDPWALSEAPLNLAAKLDLADIGWVAGLSSNLRRISGQVAGKLVIGGNLLEPRLGGTLELAGGELRLATGGPPVRNLAAELAFEGQLVRLRSLTGEIGGAPVRASGTVEPFGPFPRLDLAIAGENLLVARDARLRLRVDADMILKGTPSQLVLRGELGIAEGSYFGEISPLEEIFRAGRRTRTTSEPRPLSLFPSGPLANAALDVHLGGKRTFDYRTNLLVTELRPDAWLRGTGAYPVLEGPVYVEEASLTLPSGKLELVSGLLTFRREAPLRPDLALTAEMRVQRHDVRATATGSLDELEIVLSSIPPLPDDDLWVLALTGQLPQDRWQDRNSQAMEALAVFLARDTLVRWFSSEPSDSESLLDRFEIDVGAETSRSGQPTGKVLFYLRPQVRRSGRATYLSAELDEYDRVNYALGIVFRPR